MHAFLRLTLLAFALPLAAQQPHIDKVDPPNWFAALPSPMLLIHGTGLSGATFTGAPSTHTVTSPNGHWAILELDTHAIRPGTLHLTAHTSSGTVSFDYMLSPRRTEGISGFSPADVITCIMPDRFADGDPSNDNLPGMPPIDRANPHAYHGGDLKGVIDHLDYLQQLGVTAVWLTPIVANNPAGRDYHGYGATDLYAVDPRLGTLADYQRLTTDLHRRHMKLFFDDVPNHFGPKHPWALDPPLPDLFHGTPADHQEAKYDFNRIMDPHYPESAANLELNGWFANVLPDLNQQNPFVAQYLLQNMIWWIEQTGLDALRIDTFPYVQRTFWQGYLSALQNIYPRLNFVGEVDNGDTNINAYFAGDRKIAGIDTHLTTPFDYPYFFALRNVLIKGESFEALETTFRQDWLYPHPELLVPVLDNHDNARFMSEKGATPELMRIATGITMTVRGTPQIYIGDEILMQGGEDPDNRRDFPGGFPGDPANAFTAAGRTPAQAKLHDFTALLGQLRAHSPALQGGQQQDVLVDKDTFAYVRTPANANSACSSLARGQSLLIAVNRASTPSTLTIPTQATVLEGCSKLSPILGDGTPQSSFTLTLPPFGFAVYRPE
ncbi:alpha-amylase family glycosyl hydrolase [Granulicella tundricola]|uniref:Alpha amylase catalytic region n=1 Tax=Granulicella tundricola (strain ATCC BAA-1859 / DSM 23138 / MP5ACTX9) TaxID=1198114 RepID=E8WVB3_GRATM|nr:alpha-amylase family glycosyl hydrolase [Granulicella tundricola]ADW67288.1 alpha amylase catalytic region [Granulicella tundricola MP5ACTX9]